MMMRFLKRLLGGSDQEKQPAPPAEQEAVKNPIDTHIEALTDDDYKVANKAAAALHARGDADTVAALINALENPDACARAADVLRKIGHPQADTAIEPLAKHMTSAERGTQLALAKALFELGDQRAVPVILQLITNPDMMHAAASYALEHGIEGAVDAFAETMQQHGKTLSDYHYAVTVETLAATGDQRGIDIAVAQLETDQALAENYALQGLGRAKNPAAISALKAYLEKKPYSTDAQWALAMLGDAEAEQAFFEGVDRLLKSDGIHWDLIPMLESLGTPRALEKLRAIVQMSDLTWTYREQALIALGKVHDRASVDLMLQELTKNGQYIGAALGLGHLKETSAVVPLTELLKSGHRDRAKAAAIALEQIGDQRAVPALIDVLEHFESAMFVTVRTTPGSSIVQSLPFDDSYTIDDYFVLALRSLTGQNFGYDAAKWRAWWNTQQAAGG